MTNAVCFRHTAMGLVAATLVAFIVACGGDDGDNADGPASTAAPPGAATEVPAATAGSTGPTGSEATATGSSGTPEEIDVCALLSQEEVEAAIGQPAGAPTFTPLGEAFAAQGLGGGDCRFEADGITPVVSLTVLVWPDAEDARSAFEFGWSGEPVEGLGDDAMRTQPVGDISVLSGPYEVSLDIYFLSEDDDADFEAARELSELVVPRLP